MPTQNGRSRPYPTGQIGCDISPLQCPHLATGHIFRSLPMPEGQGLAAYALCSYPGNIPVSQAMRPILGVGAPASGSLIPAAPDKAIGGQACVSCRRVKMRCRLAEGSETCQRCYRRRTSCVFEEPKKRGRKSQVYVWSWAIRLSCVVLVPMARSILFWSRS